MERKPHDIEGLVGDLAGLELIRDEAILRQRSRDFYWYSPVLKRQLDGVCADLVVEPRDEAEVMATLAACHARAIPTTVRAGGTGNYGQAMPLAGGVVLDVSRMNAVRWIRPGAIRADAGIRLQHLERATVADSAQELRFFPSTRKLGTLGGFVAGGSSGVGSVTWGILGEPGNVLGLRVVTMEAEPRAIELRGPELAKVTHAYGTNGVITEVEMPLAPAYLWREHIVAFDDFMDSVRYADALSTASGVLKKLVTPIPAPVPQRYFRPMRQLLGDHEHIVVVMVAEHSEEAFRTLTEQAGGRLAFDRERFDGHMPPLYEFTWNHTTLQALKIDSDITYLQSLFPPGRHVELVQQMHEHFGDEVATHLEFVRFGGEVACFGLQLVRFSTEARLAEIIAYHEAHGVPVFNPHAYTIEEGGMKEVDHLQLDFKREADPEGLLNPGKMIAWERPDYDGRAAVRLF